MHRWLPIWALSWIQSTGTSAPIDATGTKRLPCLLSAVRMIRTMYGTWDCSSAGHKATHLHQSVVYIRIRHAMWVLF